MRALRLQARAGAIWRIAWRFLFAGEGDDDGAPSLRRALREIALPRARWLYALHLGVVVQALAYWRTSFAQDPGLPFALRTFYRAGDIQYYPLVAAIGRLNFGEPVLAEGYRAGWTAFPFASVALHGFSFRVLGPPAFLLMDVLVALGYLVAVGALLRVLGVPRTWAALAAALVATGAMFHYWRLVTGTVGLIPPQLFPALWGQRFPRPLVTEPMMVLALAGLVRLARDSPAAPPRPWSCAAVGGLVAAVVQGDVHAAFSLGLAAAALPVLWLGWRAPDRPWLVRTGALLAGALAVAAPFILQQLLAHPDLPRRLGVFAVSRAEPLSDVQRQVLRLSNLLGWTFVAALAAASIRPATPRPGRGLLMATAVAVVSLFALPLMCVLLGRLVQTSHFHDRWYRFSSYAFLGAALWLLLGVWRLVRMRVTGRAGSWLVARATPVAMAVLVMGGIAAQIDRDHPTAISAAATRADFGRYGRVPDYKRQLVGLVGALEQQRKQGARTLGTLDHQIYVYWTTFLRGFVLVPDPFSSAAPDAEVERRLLAFAKLLGVRPEQLPALIEDPAVLIFFLGHNKYQATRAHHFAPLADYPPPVQQAIIGTPIWDSWRVALPISERQRLERRFTEIPPAGQGGLAAPDLVALSRVETAAGLVPPPALYSVVYENPSFLLWARRR